MVSYKPTERQGGDKMHREDIIQSIIVMLQEATEEQLRRIRAFIEAYIRRAE